MNDLRPYYTIAAQISAFFADHGFTLEQAYGVVANADAESSLRPRAIGDHHHAFGLFQLHRDRFDLIRSGCGIDMKAAAAEGQCAGVLWELNHCERRAMIALRAAKSAFDAGHDFCRYYERPGDTRQYQIRGDKAEGWLKYFRAHPLP